MKVIESRTVRITRVRRIEIDRETLLSLVGQYADCGDVPENAAVYIDVPGGGDWSNTQLDINSETPVTITWTEIEDEAGV